ncbi:MAG: tRNA pseudouridine(13) synthase TruD [Sinobacteraceae bacterium]|nr:tRNA pseudouridine(13) synthase TruD [Nevskiaceae bacterium]
MPDVWRELALQPPRVAAGARPRAVLRQSAEDFVVEERLGFAPAGRGEHVLLRVRKRDANTGWVARELAALAGARPQDVGYAGLKDRRAVATQWFTVPGRRRPAAEWPGIAGEGFEVLEAHAHTRKLPRGALVGNHFALTLRDVRAEPGALEARLAVAAAEGVPNWFGPQRFGRELSNLEALRVTVPVQRVPAGFVLSAARSLVFNAVLAARVRDGSWNRLLPGDRANLDGSNAVFAVTAVDAALEARLAALDVHPSGPLWGRGESGVAGAVAALEQQVAAEFPEALAVIAAARLEAARRPLRLAVRELHCEWLEPAQVCRVSFALRSGAFATAVMRECLDTDGLPEEGGDA